MELDSGCNNLIGLCQIDDNLKNLCQVDSNLKNLYQIESELSAPKQINSNIQGYVEVAIAYKGGETDNIIVDVDNSTRTITATKKPIQYSSLAEFPSIGSDKLLYVALDENATYMWKADELRYICIGRDYTEIEVIDGGRA